MIGTYVARVSNRHGWPLQRFEMDGEIDAARNPATVSTSENPSLSEKLFSCDLIWVGTLVPHLGLGKKLSEWCHASRIIPRAKDMNRNQSLQSTKLVRFLEIS